mmetsp:Transcript_50775/g.120664  ORF Transcript_50775/g.120664 Transcript_50775/m.120664 type:complete len:196 (-) Transcript_50775:73-660(-)|eukprot:CAMPEP_0178414822 /NCGR_PEP_ID=MMETSP0689_2-20121128/23233_1 /TAXON_ID=160604 /ORGANISM="Amphidinium massartii, Strain CS-259" /LENGTH=195 /DNA_ID=CAMNT_0020036121 /DNA_START=86 /DNA_END=673 /DNA_ORIENTATION=-
MSSSVMHLDASSAQIRQQQTPHMRPLPNPELSSSLLAELELDFELPEAAVGATGAPRLCPAPAPFMDLDELESFDLPPAYEEVDESFSDSPNAQGNFKENGSVNGEDSLTLTFDLSGDESESEKEETSNFKSKDDLNDDAWSRPFLRVTSGPYMDRLGGIPLKNRRRQTSSTCSTKSSSPVHLGGTFSFFPAYHA